MARNIEIKARIENHQALAAKVAKIADQAPLVVVQNDTFFTCTNGRMKLRIISDTEGELIFYLREDKAGPKESSYEIYLTSAPNMLREILSLGYGIIGCVSKRRTIFMAGRTRIHLDDVDGLGHFLELEVLLADGEPSEAGSDVANNLLKMLGIPHDKLVEGSYLDLLNSKNPNIL